jgi:hypothetical protein
MDVPLVSGNQEIEEPRERAGLAFTSAPRLSPLVPQKRKEPVSIRRRRRPERTSQETGELKDHGTLRPDELVGQTRTNLRQRKLIHQFLLEVFLVLRRLQCPTEPYGTNGGKDHHAHPGSAILSTDHRYHERFRNHEIVSPIRRSLKLAGMVRIRAEWAIGYSYMNPRDSRQPRSTAPSAAATRAQKPVGSAARATPARQARPHRRMTRG